jgi:hypothetical protein
VDDFVREKRNVAAKAIGPARSSSLDPANERSSPGQKQELRWRDETLQIQSSSVAPHRQSGVLHVCSSATERSRPATISSAFLISEVKMAEEIYLTQYGLTAERHWREFRPTMVSELEARGTLMEALFEAQETTGFACPANCAG